MPKQPKQEAPSFGAVPDAPLDPETPLTTDSRPVPSPGLAAVAPEAIPEGAGVLQPEVVAPAIPEVAATPEPDPEPEPIVPPKPTITTSGGLTGPTCEKCRSKAIGIAGGRYRCNQCGHSWG